MDGEWGQRKVGGAGGGEGEGTGMVCKKKKDCFKIKKCRRCESYKAYIKSLTNLKNNKNIVKCFLRLGFWSYESLSLTLLGLFTICL